MQLQCTEPPEGSRRFVAGLVSVVIPTYNQVGFVRETIDSVLAQDYQQLQIIVTDDGSTDGTAQLAKEYADRFPDKVSALTVEKNTGIPANFNRGLREVRGEYIAWLGGDDLMLPGKIRKQVKLLESRKDAVGCCHDAEVFQSATGEVIGSFCVLKNGGPTFREGGVELLFIDNYFMLPSTSMIRSSAVPAHGFDGRLKYLNDWLLDVEIFRQGKCVPINEVLGRYRRHDNNVSGSTAARSIGTEEAMIALAIIENRYPELCGYVNKRRKAMYLLTAMQAFRGGDLQGASRHLFVAIRSGAVLRGVALLVALRVLGPYIQKQLLLPTFGRSAIYVKLKRLFWGA
jgi:glycosyltransferase involved in cell wall biosynthesis